MSFKGGAWPIMLYLGKNPYQMGRAISPYSPWNRFGKYLGVFKFSLKIFSNNWQLLLIELLFCAVDSLPSVWFYIFCTLGHKCHRVSIHVRYSTSQVEKFHQYLFERRIGYMLILLRQLISFICVCIYTYICEHCVSVKK